MTLEILEKKLKEARKANAIIEKEVLISAINAVKNAAIAKKCKDNVPEELVNEVLLKEKKIIQEQIDSCPPDRVMLCAEYIEKKKIIDKYCPQLLTDKVEIKKIINKELVDAGLECTQANRGAAMKLLMPQFKGKADMKIVNQVISEMFSRKDKDK